MNPEAVARLCDAISGGSLDGAAALAQAELPFEGFDRAKRRLSDAESHSTLEEHGNPSSGQPFRGVALDASPATASERIEPAGRVAA